MPTKTVGVFDQHRNRRTKRSNSMGFGKSSQGVLGNTRMSVLFKLHSLQKYAHACCTQNYGATELPGLLVCGCLIVWFCVCYHSICSGRHFGIRGCISPGERGGRSTGVSFFVLHLPSFCSACLKLCHETGPAVPFTRQFFLIEFCIVRERTLSIPKIRVRKTRP